MFELLNQTNNSPRISVFGVGGCGCNTINQLSQVAFNDNVQLIAVNTDYQSLAISQCSTRLQIGIETTKGLGAGAIPQKGYDAAQESEPEIRELIKLSDIIFITGGMGGGTGTGAIPYMASVARELNKPLVAVVTTPFGFEGNKRMQLANTGLEELMQQADAVIVLPNDKLGQMLDKKITLVNAFFESNRILQDVLKGVTTTISQSGLVNIDLNDFISVISHQGRAVMGVAKQMPNEDLQQTICNALKNPLLEDVDLTQAKGAIVSIMANENIELSQYNKIGETLHHQLDPSAMVIIGLTIVPDLDCEIELMVIATGIPTTERKVPIQSTMTPSLELKERFTESEILNIHEFLNAQPNNSVDDSHLEYNYDIPTYSRQLNIN
ncbi:cell division protein FtsZ [Shewanella sp. AC91-MNA-CIBAN-0169]|uniref:cell division protein FtsZ n=1 Tax=Shewanella sp. AC91-MNA-CIBAN-0169 TaxID=3140466 RepID=UPI003318C008